jgi:hypothetical protein
MHDCVTAATSMMFGLRCRLLLLLGRRRLARNGAFRRAQARRADDTGGSAGRWWRCGARSWCNGRRRSSSRPPAAGSPSR